MAMSAKKRRRLWFAAAIVAAGGLGGWLVVWALGSNTMFFRSPTDVAEGKINPAQRFRVGGLVEAGSVVKNGENVSFAVTDMTNTLNIKYTGLLPDLFREGQGMVANGRLGADGTFRASEVLARHDETYMPPEAAEALKRAGHWKPGAAPPGKGKD